MMVIHDGDNEDDGTKSKAKNALILFAYFQASIKERALMIWSIVFWGMNEFPQSTFDQNENLSELISFEYLSYW